MFKTVLATALAVLTSCSKSGTNSISTPAEAQATLESAFSNARPELKAMATNAAATLQNQPGNALLQLQALSANPDLEPEQRNAAQESMIVVVKKLQTAATQGDPEAEKLLEAYRASK